MILFNTYLRGEGGSYFSQCCLAESERNLTTGVRTRLQRFYSPAL